MLRLSPKITLSATPTTDEKVEVSIGIEGKTSTRTVNLTISPLSEAVRANPEQALVDQLSQGTFETLTLKAVEFSLTELAYENYASAVRDLGQEPDTNLKPECTHLETFLESTLNALYAVSSVEAPANIATKASKVASGVTLPTVESTVVSEDAVTEEVQEEG